MNHATKSPVALVTGGGSGIGEAAALELAGRGYHVALAGRRREPLEQVASRARESGNDALTVVADLEDPAAPAVAVEQTLAAYGRLDAVVNNAAFIAHRPFGEFAVEDFDRHVAVNVRAPFLILQAALPALRLSRTGAVVNVSSAAGSMARPGQAAYGLSKAALEHLTRSLAHELAPYGIRVNAVAPGPVETAVHASYSKDAAARLELLRRSVPLGRFGTAQEVAWWIAALLDARAGWVTGAVLAIDGGRTLGSPDAI